MSWVAVTNKSNATAAAASDMLQPYPPSQLPSVTRSAGLARWLFSWTARFAEFAFVQCWVQLLTAISGMMIVRTLSKDQYALFGITNGMQTVINSLAGLGIGIGVQSIGGRVWHDRGRFGQLLNTALQLRHTFAIASIAVCLPVATWMLRRNGADWVTTLLLCAVIVATVLPQLSSSVLEVTFRLSGEYRRLQQLDFVNAILRVAAVGVLALSRMNAWLAASVAAVVSWRSFRRLHHWAPQHADFTAPTNADDRRELCRLSLRILPNTLFFCVQGQVTLLILTYFGNPTGIADVTALGRLTVLLMVFSLAFNNVLVPRFARCQESIRLAPLYLGLVGATALMVVPVLLAAWFTPRPLLWLLGGKYMALERECGWVVSAACVSHLAVAMNQLNSSKSWIRVGSIFYAPLTIAVQIVALTLLDVSQLDGVLIFNFITSLTALPTLIADACLGLRRRRAPG